MKKTLIAGLLLAGGSLFAAPSVRFGVTVGGPVPVAPAHEVPVAPVYVPPCPGPDYVFIGGRWEHRPVIEHRIIDHGRRIDHRFDRR